MKEDNKTTTRTSGGQSDILVHTQFFGGASQIGESGSNQALKSRSVRILHKFIEHGCSDNPHRLPSPKSSQKFKRDFVSSQYAKDK